MRSFCKKYRLFITLFIVFCSSVCLATAQTYSQIPFVVYNSEKVFRSSELGQEIIRRYNKIVQEQGEAAKIAAKSFEAEEDELVRKRSILSTEEFKVLADDFDNRVRETRIIHKNKDNQIRKLYGDWKENFFNETIPRAFQPISKEYGVYAAVDLMTSKNLVYRENIEVTELFIKEINNLYKENIDIFKLIIENKNER